MGVNRDFAISAGGARLRRRLFMPGGTSVMPQTSQVNRSQTTEEGAPRQPEALILPDEVEREINEGQVSLGSLGRPFDRRNPFFVGLTGALGVSVAYVIFRGIADIASVLVIVGLSLFIAIGLNPIIESLVARSIASWRRRWPLSRLASC